MRRVWQCNGDGKLVAPNENGHGIMARRVRPKLLVGRKREESDRDRD